MVSDSVRFLLKKIKTNTTFGKSIHIILLLPKNVLGQKYFINNKGKDLGIKMYSYLGPGSLALKSKELRKREGNAFLYKRLCLYEN